MMVSGKKINNAVMVCFIITIAAKNMKDNCKTGSIMVKARIVNRMGRSSIMANGKIAINMVMVYCIIEMEQTNIKVS
jgi:hypothetical protein